MGEEVQVAGIVRLKWMGNVPFTDGDQGMVGPRPEVFEHLGALSLQRSAAVRVVRCPLHKGRNAHDLLLERGQLGLGGGSGFFDGLSVPLR